MASNMGFIYYLQNPVSGEIFYVGSTQCSLNNRLRTHYQHLREFERGKRGMNNRYTYLQNLRPDKATIHLLEIVTNISELELREIFYIKKFRDINPNLTNMTDGGKGKCTHKYYTEQQMENYSKKLSEAGIGRKMPEWFGEKLSKERQGIDNPNAKPIKEGGIIGTKDRISFVWFRHGFEINKFFNSIHAYGNVYRFVGTTNKPYKYEFKFFNNASKRIQDLVILNNVK